MRIAKWPRKFWAVYDHDDILICVTVYKKGAKEVVRRLTSITQLNTSKDSANQSCPSHISPA
jgi:hypothetical protein